ncbi:MAG: vWA domain-containing protein [Nanoarchaeota archaeon]|nr:vWA domain-containing protein [Nanoarchaeota archaeon]
MKNKRGAFFSLDALIALIIILMTLLIVFPIITYPKHETKIESDIIKVLSNIKIGEIDDNYVKNVLIFQGKIVDPNKSVFDQIGEFCIEDIDLAISLANSTLNDIDSRENFGIWCENNLIYLKNSSSYEDSENVRVSRRIISGVNKSEGASGFSGRAFLSSSVQTKYFYFGGYMGDGNISVFVNYSGNLNEIMIEIVVNKDFDVYINGLYSGHWTNSSDEFTPKEYDLSAYKSYFKEGNNTFKIVGNNTHITGGFVRLLYSNSTIYEEPDRYYFPGIEGIINLYDGFYSPGTINNMNIFLHYNSSYVMFLNIGNVTVYNSSSNGLETEINLNNSYLMSILDYNDISNKTIPIRLGLEEIMSGGTGGNADVVLITDLSGSMDYTMDADVGGIDRNCSDNSLYNSTTKRISLAKCLDKMVVDLILNYSGNRLALSAFYADNSPPYKARVKEVGLTNNIIGLKNNISNYSVEGGTCICCALNDAYKILSEQSDPSRKKFVIVMSDGIPTHTCQSSSGCTGTRTGLPGDEGLWLGFGAGCYGGSDDCNVNDCSCASRNANWSACRLNQGLNATVIYSIGFGPVGTCTMANNTMSNIAKCGGGKYYSSSNASILKELYENVSQEIIKLSYSEQASNVSGSVFTKLFHDSYIQYNFTKKQVPYGLHIALENKFIDSYYGSFDIPLNSTIVEAKAVSYSGPKWTKNVKINNGSIYNLSLYGGDYRKLGDPYAVYIPNNLIKDKNNVSITLGISPENYTNGSINNKIIYKVVKNLGTFSEGIYKNALGCYWSVQFEDNTNLTLNIPSNYSEDNICLYQQDNHAINDLGDRNDAINIAVYSLFKLLDFDDNGKLDLKFNEQNFDISSSQITGIPYSEYITVEVRTWD